MYSLYSSRYGQSSILDGQNQIGKTSIGLDATGGADSKDNLLEMGPPDQERAVSGSQSLPGTMQQLNQAIQTPEDSGKIDVNAENSKGQGAHSGFPGNTGATGTNTPGNQPSDPQAKEKMDAAPKVAQAQQEQQSGQAQSNQQSAEGKQAEGAQNNAAQTGGPGGANQKEESPGQALNREVQETRQSIQNGQAEPNPADQTTTRSSAGGGANAEGVLTQTSQKAHMADQDHKRGTKLNITGMIQEKKGQVMQKSGDILSKVGTALSTAGSAMAAAGQAMMSNPFTMPAGAALIAAGNALKAVGTGLKASGESLKSRGESMQKSGQKTEKDGGKLTKKANQSAQMGHQQLEALRNGQSSNKTGEKPNFATQKMGATQPQALNGQNRNDLFGGSQAAADNSQNSNSGSPFRLASAF
jgi:hypothetical protein